MNGMEPLTTPAPRTGLILVDDLMFASQIQGLARSAGVNLQWVRNAEKAIAQTEAAKPVCVILDVNLLGAAIDDFVAALKALGGPVPVLIGFGSHVDAAGLQRARDAGCNLVLPRSKLVQELATRLAAWIGTV
jgi:DNA-binding response OmpR family regulator